VRLVVLVTALVACGRLGFDAVPSARDAPGSGDAPNLDAIASAPAFVEYADATVGSGSDISVAYPEPVTAGDLLVVTIGYQLTPVPDLGALVDSANDAFVVLPYVESTVAYAREYVAYAIASSSGSNTVHATLSASGAYMALRVHEYTNVDSMEPFDTYASNTGDAIGSDAISVAIETAAPNELVFAYAVSTVGEATAGTGFTPRSTTAGDTTEDRVESGSGAQLVTATTNDNSWSIQAVSIRGQ
jgi:hypothetical protein